MLLADYVIKFLEKYGVSHIFTVPGGGCIFLLDALTRVKKLSYVACHHEQGASIAAEGYARIKNDLGVNLVTSGPGGTNVVTGVAGAWLDHVPHLTISGQVFSNQMITKHPGLRTLGVQEINIVDIVKPITKYAVIVDKPEDIKFHLEKALYLAKSGRPGPVWLDIPANIQNTKIDPNDLKGFYPENTKNDNKLDQKITEVLDLLLLSKRPLVHIGQGIRIAGAEKELEKFLKLLEIPVMTARNGNDIIGSDHELYIGRPGTYAQRGPNFAVQSSDFYLAIGTRLSLAQTGYNAKDYARNAKFVMVDIDKAELNKDTVNIDIKVEADALEFLKKMNIQLQTLVLENKNWKPWLIKCKKLQKKYPPVLTENREQKNTVNSYYLIEILSDYLDKNDIVVTDMGFSFQNTHQAFNIKKGQRLFTNCGLASMGWGLPAAIGASFAAGSKRVICISGDGGFQMNGQELATIMHHNLPVKLFILNNEGYSTQRQAHESGFDGRVVASDQKSGLSFPSFEHIAEAHKLKYEKLSNSVTLEAEVHKLLDYNGPVLCEIMMDKDQEQAPKSVNRRKTDGSTQQTAIEDSYPFLDPKEIEDNLKIID